MRVIVEHGDVRGEGEADWGESTASDYDLVLAAFKAAAEAAGFDSKAVMDYAAESAMKGGAL